MSDDKTLLQNLQNVSLTEIAIRRGNPIDGGIHGYLDAEITRRTAQAQIDAAKWMKWSVVAIAVTTSLVALFGYLGWMYPHTPN